jgi:pimeloyl-ACP methyl ester carboxylesterase
MRPITINRDAVQLIDGRRLVYSAAGPRDGIPIVYCHGAIGTPLDRMVDVSALAWDLGVRYIAVQRPGIGGSDPAPGRTVLDFAGDLRQFADRLGLERLSVVGVSAGGPYALAAAYVLGERIDRVALCSSLSPLCAPHRTPGIQWRIRLGLGALARAPGLCCGLGDVALPVIRRHPVLVNQVIAAHAAPAERARLREPGDRAAASGSFLDAAGDSVRGMVEDYLTYSRGWGFSVENVTQCVHLWHGVEDPIVPIEHALQLAATLPDCRAFFDADEGHHFFRRRVREILGVLIGRDRVPAGVAPWQVADAREAWRVAA